MNARPLVVLLAALPLALPAPAWAAPDGKSPPPEDDPPAGETNDAEGEGEGGGGAPGSPSDETEASAPSQGSGASEAGKAPKEGADRLPPSTSYQIEIAIRQREAAIEADRKRAIVLLEEFIDKHASSPAMPEALYRLAALYWERSQEKFLSNMERWAARVDACKEKPESCPNGPPPEPQLDLTPSQALYERMLAQYPGFRKIDTVRYLYGFSLRDQGRLEEAQKQFWAIIREHPDSSFVPDAWLAVGDHRFYQTNDWRRALEAYQHVLDYPNSDPYAMALFKAAWCHWKLGQRESAIRRFKQVLDQAGDPTQDEAGRKRLADLREEALEYLVQIISEDETQTPKGVYDFLASIGGEKYSRKVLVRLGEAYEAQTRYDKSVPTWRFLIDLDPAHGDAADYQLHVFTGVRGLAKWDKALDELAVLEERFGPKTPWGKAHPAQASKVHARAEKLLYDFARSIHESAQAHEKDTKVPDQERYALAARAYEDYTRRFPATPHAVEIAYLLGDIYFFKLRRLEAAGDAYLRVGESAPVGPLHRDALLAAMTAYEKVLAEGEPEPPQPAPKEKSAEGGGAAEGASSAKGEDSPKGEAGTEATKASSSGGDEDPAGAQEPEADASGSGAEAGPRTGPRPLGRVERKFVRAVDLFVALFPKDEEIGAVVYRLGEFFYARGDYDRSVQRFGKVVIDYPESSQAGAAGDRILESLARAKDYDNIELWAQKLKKTKAFAADEEQARLDRIIVESLMAHGTELSERGYYGHAASYFLRVAREHPKHPQAPLALSNAGAALERADRASDATAIYEELVEAYPKSPEAAQATLIVARVYENIARYERAAARYDLLVERYPKHPARAEALYNAGILAQALGDRDRAIARYRRYVKSYPDREDAVDVALRIGQVLADEGKSAKAVSAFKSFERKYARNARVIEARTRHGAALLAMGKTRAANKVLQAAVKAGRKAEGPMLVFAAQARYLQAEVIYRRFEAAKLDSKPSKLGASLERKAKLLAEAKDVYLDVLTFRSAEWSTAALYRIGEAYENFAKSLRAYPVPKGLTQEQEDAYMEQLDTFALAFEEQAIEAYKSGYAKALELQIYNEHTQKMRAALGRLSKQEFPPLAEIGAEVLPAEGTALGGRPMRRLAR